MSCQHAISALPAGSCPSGEDAADLPGFESLTACLGGLPDPRRKRGIRHRVAVVLAFAVAAVMAGADSVTAIAEWAADVPPEVLAVLGAHRDRRGLLVPPSRSTFRRVLRRLDGQVLAAAFGAWLSRSLVSACPYVQTRARVRQRQLSETITLSSPRQSRVRAAGG